jgi:hypothetical protein
MGFFQIKIKVGIKIRGFFCKGGTNDNMGENILGGTAKCHLRCFFKECSIDIWF